MVSRDQGDLGSGLAMPFMMNPWTFVQLASLDFGLLVKDFDFIMKN